MKLRCFYIPEVFGFCAGACVWKIVILFHIYLKKHLKKVQKNSFSFPGGDFTSILGKVEQIVH